LVFREIRNFSLDNQTEHGIIHGDGYLRTRVRDRSSPGPEPKPANRPILACDYRDDRSSGKTRSANDAASPGRAT